MRVSQHMSSHKGQDCLTSLNQTTPGRNSLPSLCGRSSTAHINIRTRPKASTQVNTHVTTRQGTTTCRPREIQAQHDMTVYVCQHNAPVRPAQLSSTCVPTPPHRRTWYVCWLPLRVSCVGECWHQGLAPVLPGPLTRVSEACWGGVTHVPVCAGTPRDQPHTTRHEHTHTHNGGAAINASAQYPDCLSSYSAIVQGPQYSIHAYTLSHHREPCISTTLLLLAAW